MTCDVTFPLLTVVVEQTPVPSCYEGTCSCPATYRYDEEMDKCVPTGEGEYDTKGPSGTGDPAEPTTPTEGENCMKKTACLKSYLHLAGTSRDCFRVL